MNILFLSLANFEDVERNGIYTDLIRKFRDQGHNLYVVSPRERRLQKPTEYIEDQGIHFLKVRIGNITKTNTFEKGISTIRVEKKFLNSIKKYIKGIKFDLILYSTPPITFEKVIRYVKNRDNAKAYLLLKDIFPQNAVDLKMINEKGLIYKYFRNKEKRLYKVSDYIGCMSKSNVNYVLKHNPEVSPNKIEVNPNTLEIRKFNINEFEKKEIRKKYDIPLNKTVFVYGGNLGKPQGIDFLIKCLKANRDNNNVHFVIAGSGTEFNKIQSFIHNENPDNVSLFKHLPKLDYEKLVNSCDVGLIFLHKNFTIPNFPSRLLTYMHASIPVLAATDPNTDIGQIIQEGKFGYWVISDDVDQFTDKLNKLCSKDLRMKMGHNGRKYLESNYTVSHSYDIIMSHFKYKKRGKKDV